MPTSANKDIVESKYSKYGENNMTLSIDGLNKVSNPSGIYFVKTEIDNEIYQDKVIFLK